MQKDFPGSPAFPPPGGAAAPHSDAELSPSPRANSPGPGGGPARPLSVPCGPQGPGLTQGPGCRRGLLWSSCNSFLLRKGDGKKDFMSRPAAFDHLMNTGGQSGLRLLRPDKGAPTARAPRLGPGQNPGGRSLGRPGKGPLAGRGAALPFDLPGTAAGPRVRGWLSVGP